MDLGGVVCVWFSEEEASSEPVEETLQNWRGERELFASKGRERERGREKLFFLFLVKKDLV